MCVRSWSWYFKRLPRPEETSIFHFVGNILDRSSLIFPDGFWKEEFLSLASAYLVDGSLEFNSAARGSMVRSSGNLPWIVADLGIETKVIQVKVYIDGKVPDLKCLQTSESWSCVIGELNKKDYFQSSCLGIS